MTFRLPPSTKPETSWFATISRLILVFGATTGIVLGTSQVNIPGATPYGEFGTIAKYLPNGNILISDPGYDLLGPVPINDVGAVFLYNGASLELINTMTGERANSRIGSTLTVLTNGNYVVSGLVWSQNYSALMGAVRFCDGLTGCSGNMTAANSLVGNKPDDYVPSRILALKNGDYLVSTSYWDNGPIENAGALTLCGGRSGCVGIISPANSLVGDNTMDQVGGFCDPCPRGVVELNDGDYISSNIRWNNHRGAVTYCPATTGCVGVVSASNSLIGSIPGQDGGDQVGRGGNSEIGVTELTNGNYVVSSTWWGETDVGASTFCSGDVGCHGIVSSANSFVGSSSNEFAGSVVALTNGNYVAVSPSFFVTSGLGGRGGAITLCPGTTGCSGSVDPSRSLIGSSGGDMIGSGGIKPLRNGNYLAVSPKWGSGRGAVTLGDGINGNFGFVSPQNSLVGSIRSPADGSDQVGVGPILELPNGNYVVNTWNWNRRRGSSTLGNAVNGISGEISPQNSLVGTNVGDSVGYSLVGLINGNYVVGSSAWNGNRGASTLCSGISGCPSTISTSNSLVGEAPGDRVSDRQTKPLSNGNYVVISSEWNADRGAVTLGDGVTGTTGFVSAANSLIGKPGDSVGSEGAVPLPNGNYVVNSLSFANGNLSRAGAITLRNGATTTGETVSATNSLVGGSVNDIIGFDSFQQGSGGGVYVQVDGAYVVLSRYWDNGSTNDAGAVTVGLPDAALTGSLSIQNSVLGTTLYDVKSFDYDPVRHQLLVGRPNSHVVTIFKLYDSVEISGRVLTPDGRGLRNASVILTDGYGIKRTSLTSSFGNYIFENVGSQQSFVLGVSSKRYRFASRTLIANGNLGNVDLSGLE